MTKEKTPTAVSLEFYKDIMHRGGKVAALIDFEYLKDMGGFVDHFCGSVSKAMAERLVAECFPELYKEIEAKLKEQLLERLSKEIFPQIVAKLDLDAVAKLTAMNLAKIMAKEVA